MKWINGRYLVSIRRNLDLTQSDLARKLGVAQATVSRWESGLHEPTRDQWHRIMDLAQPQHHAHDWSTMFMVRMARSPLILATLDLNVLEVADPAISDEGISRRDFLNRSLHPQVTDSLAEAFSMAEERGLFESQAIGMVVAGIMRRLDGTLTPHISTWTPLRRTDGTPILLWQREYVSEQALGAADVPGGAQILTFEDIFGNDGALAP